MALILTITKDIDNQSFNLQVNEHQKIIDTLTIISDNKNINIKCDYLQSLRTKRKINTLLTFKQAGILTGEHLIILRDSKRGE